MEEHLNEIFNSEYAVIAGYLIISRHNGDKFTVNNKNGKIYQYCPITGVSRKRS